MYLQRIAPALAIAALCAGLMSCTGPGTARREPARVIWIAVDSLRADHVGAYGYDRPTTPWLDEFAAQSVRFEWALTPANHTLRSVAGYFSGVPYTMLQESAAEHGLPAETVTLAEALKGAGLRTLAYTSNAVLGNVQGFKQGFDEYHFVAEPGQLKASLDEMTSAIRRDYRRSSGREFIYVHTMDVHYPYRPPAPYGAMFATEPYAGRAVVEGMPVCDEDRTPATSSLPYWDPKGWVDDAAVRYLTELYDGAIRYTDSRLEALLEALEWDPETDVVIISADHGDQLYEKKWFSHFETLTPMEIRVPLIVNYAGFDARTVKACASLLDLYPTLLELFGAEMTERTLGKSLVETLRGGAEPGPRLIYSENAPKAGLSVAAVSDEYWYWMRLNRTQHEPWEIWPYEEYLFRYREDSGFGRNLINEEAQVAEEINARLRELNPRWAAYSRERIREPIDGVHLGENLFQGPMSSLSEGVPVFTADGDGWTAETAVAGLRGRATGIEPGGRYLLRVPYTLESGRIRVALSPAEFKRPGLGRVDYVWRHELVTSSSEASLLSVVVVPAGEAVDLRVVFDPGTIATLGEPELRRIDENWVEPWPAPADKWQDRDDAEELERLRALGYV